MTTKSMDKALLGALAGVVATMAMTATMRRLHAVLPKEEQYPLPPREIIDAFGPSLHRHRAPSRALLGHFGFGGAAGAMFALLPPARGLGIGYGLAVWAVSYLGWIPATRVLAPAYRHPVRRNLLMIAAHVVWGLTLATSLKEMQDAADDAFGSNRAQLSSKKALAERGQA